MPQRLVYQPPNTKTHPMENSRRTDIREECQGDLARCPFCHEVRTLQEYDFTCLYMPSLERDPAQYVFKGCEGECPECERYVRLEDVQKLNELA